MLDSSTRRSGFGYLIYEEGNFYEGIIFVADLLGEWHNDRCDGYGRYIDHRGSWYEGFWKGDEKDGYGVSVLADKRKLEGQWVNNMLNGEACITHPNSTYYKGYFKDNLFVSGVGMEILPNGKIYEGEFQDAHYHGEGKISYPDGSTYIGEFKMGRGDGNGVLMKISGVCSIF